MPSIAHLHFNVPQSLLVLCSAAQRFLLQCPLGIATLTRLTNADIIKEPALVTKAALLVEFLSRPRHGGSLLPEGCGDAVRHSAATLLLSVDERICEVPRVQMVLCACSAMLTAAQTTLAGSSDHNFSSGSSNRTLCDLSIQWAAADGPRLSCRKQSLAFVVQTLEACAGSGDPLHVAAVRTEAEETGLLRRLIADIEVSCESSDARQVALAFIGTLVSAESAKDMSGQVEEFLPADAPPPPSIAVEQLIRLVHAGNPAEKIAVCNLLSALFGRSNRSAILRLRGLSDAGASPVWLGDLFMGLQNLIAVSTERAQRSACACIDRCLTFCRGAKYDSGVSAILEQRWTWLLVRCAFSSGAPAPSRCWHIFELVATLVHHGAFLEMLCDPADFLALVLRCRDGREQSLLDTDRLANLISAAETAIMDDAPRHTRLWQQSSEELARFCGHAPGETM